MIIRIGKSVIVLIVALIAASIILGSVSVASTYQYNWRLNFAEKHLEIAQGVTDADSQYTEISKTIEILQIFPKEGNYLIYNQNYPTTDMKTAWSALYQLQNYSNEIKGLDRNSSAYQLGIYNSQEKISYFKTTLWDAYTIFVYWGVKGWVRHLAFLTGIIGFAGSELVLMTGHLRRNLSRNIKIILCAAVASQVIAAVILYYIVSVPVFYTGPV
jgi:hypothetical protein